MSLCLRHTDAGRYPFQTEERPYALPPNLTCHSGLKIAGMANARAVPSLTKRHSSLPCSLKITPMLFLIAR